MEKEGEVKKTGRILDFCGQLVTHRFTAYEYPYSSGSKREVREYPQSLVRLFAEKYIEHR
jgi:hypothetical protein